MSLLLLLNLVTGRKLAQKFQNKFIQRIILKVKVEPEAQLTRKVNIFASPP